MTIKVFLNETSVPLVHINVKSAYTKGHLYCVMLEDRSVYKYPIVNIFRILEQEDLNVSR